MRLALFFLKIVIFTVCSNSVASEEARSGHEQMRDKLLNHCDMVFHCVSTKVLDVYPTKTEVQNNEKFMFALKGGELIVPKNPSLLGDGTLNYELTLGGCDKETGKFSGGPLGGTQFQAKMWDGRWVEFRNNRIMGVDASGDSTAYRTRIWYAACENFD